MGRRTHRGPPPDAPHAASANPPTSSPAAAAHPRLARRALLGALLAATAGRATAQLASEGGPVRTIFVPFPPGGGSDVLVRRVARWAQERSGTIFRIVNVPGAGGVIAVNQLLRTPPEEAALLWANSGLICSVPLLSKPPLPFDTLRDLAPVSMVVAAPLLLVAARDLPAGDLAELQAYARRVPQGLPYACNDVGSAPHLAAETILRRLGAKGTHVPYRLIDQGALDVAEGRVPLGVFTWQYVAAHVKSERIKVVAVLDDEPLEIAPHLPTVRSQGFGPFDVSGWFGFFVASTVPAVVRLGYEQQLAAIVRGADFARFVPTVGYRRFHLGADESVRFLPREVSRVKGLLGQIGLI